MWKLLPMVKISKNIEWTNFETLNSAQNNRPWCEAPVNNYRVCGIFPPEPHARVSYVQICPGLNANEIQIPYDKHHIVSSLVKSHQKTHTILSNIE